MQQNSIETDSLVLDGRKKLSMTCVEAVDGFTEQSLKITVKGNKVNILGSNIKISSFNKNTGSLTAEGEFFEIKYLGKKQSIVKRLFK